ncbi:MAG: hypothetical protein KKF77_01685 [Proteobacteria bacterium]|nr:hypothetical protein [Pseudomonadota bacterium]
MARLALALAITLAFSLVAPVAQAEDSAEGGGRAAETATARKAMSEILDSLTTAPQQQQRQTPTGFPGRSGKSGQFPSSPGNSTPRQTGPTAPAQPKAPVVKALSTSPNYDAPLPGSAFSDAPGQPANRQNTRPATQAGQRRDAPPVETLRLSHDGLERLALISLPPALQPKAKQKGPAGPRLPLVIFLHGAGGSARQAMQQTGLAALSQRAGFIAVFPEGLAAPQGQEYAGIQTWNAWSCCGYARDQKVDDVGYLAELISRLKADYPVDPRRVFLAGFSNGAMLASRFALERPGVAAALASVAGYLPCDVAAPPEPLPVLIIHGNHDRVARFGPTPGQPRTGRFCEDFPAKAQADFWVRGQNLKAKPQQVQDGQNRRTRVERYGPDKNAGRALVEFVIVKGGGHAWPGGEAVRYRYCDLPTPDPDATTLIWDFFKRQARPGPQDKADKPQKSAGKPVKPRG